VIVLCIGATTSTYGRSSSFGYLRQPPSSFNSSAIASATGATGVSGDMVFPSAGPLKELEETALPKDPNQPEKEGPAPEASMATGPGAAGVPLTGQVGLTGYTLETFDDVAKNAFRQSLADTAGIDIMMALISGVQDGNTLPVLGAPPPPTQLSGLHAGAATDAVHAHTNHATQKVLEMVAPVSATLPAACSPRTLACIPHG